MSVEDFNKHKRRKKLRSSSINSGWLKSVYNPKEFRKINQKQLNQKTKSKILEKKVISYIVVLGVAMVFLLVYAVLKKKGLVE